ncbi:MAG TPA: hypothetical protein VF806_02600, partial [Anaerolineaceae bacterium]
EAVRGCAAADGRSQASLEDLKTVAQMALRLRQSPFMVQYFHNQGEEEKRLDETLGAIMGDADSAKERKHGQKG